MVVWGEQVHGIVGNWNRNKVRCRVVNDPSMGPRLSQILSVIAVFRIAFTLQHYNNKEMAIACTTTSSASRIKPSLHVEVRFKDVTGHFVRPDLVS